MHIFSELFTIKRVRVFFHEQNHFKKLSKQGQDFLLSVCLFNIINPIFVIFISAFLWRRTEDVMLVALFSLAQFSILPIGFYCNGQLLKRFSVKKLYFLGAVTRALFIGVLMLFPIVSMQTIVLFGMIYGFTSGLFFSNRNLLAVELTSHSNRIFFSSLDFISQTVSNIIVPIAIGSFLIFGTTHAMYTPQQGYYVIAALMVCLSLALGTFVKKIKVKTPLVEHIVLQGGSQQWNVARGIQFLMGLLTGILQFLPILIVLLYVGKEDTLGIIQSIAAVFSGVIMYTIAQTINTKFRFSMIVVSISFYLLGAIILAVNFTAVGMFCFIALITVAQQLLMTEVNSLILDVIDHENKEEDNKYKYVMDLELVLNVGRVTGIMFFFLYIKAFSLDFAMQYTPLFYTIAVTAIIILAKSIESKIPISPNHPDISEVYTQNPKS